MVRVSRCTMKYLEKCKYTYRNKIIVYHLFVLSIIQIIFLIGMIILNSSILYHKSVDTKERAQQVSNRVFMCNLYCQIDRYPDK